MDSRFAIARTIYTGPRSVVCAGRDRMTGREIAVKISKNADVEVANMLRALHCDPRKVCALVVGRAVEPRELRLEGALAAEHELRARCERHRAVVTELHVPAPDVPPDCAGDHAARDAMLPYFSAVAELHARSTLEAHCDVKFANFVAPTGGGPADRCLVDLELAQPPGLAGRRRKRGTPAYMAPESLLWGEVNRWVDSWALGVMLFQACHPGRMHPFFEHNDLTTSVMLHAMAETDYRPDMWTNESAPLAADLVERLLRRRVSGRTVPEESLGHPLFDAAPRVL